MKVNGTRVKAALHKIEGGSIIGLYNMTPHDQLEAAIANISYLLINIVAVWTIQTTITYM